MGTTLGVYEKWAKYNGIQTRVDEIGENARLLWFTERRTEKVILYIHGGTYCLPLQYFAASFWAKAVDTINYDTQSQIGLVALNYSLIPTAYFPTQLKQTVLAIQHLISCGTTPDNIHIVGESAGGALILQLLSHILHPVSGDGVPQLTLGDGAKLGSGCIMSPWVSLNGKTGSHLANSDSDVLPASTWAYLGEQSSRSLSNSATIRPYLEALSTPEGWFSGIDGIVKRVMVTVGENECLRDDVLEVARKLGNDGDGFLTTVLDRNGVHNDQYLDIMAGEQPQGDLVAKIILWLKEGLTVT